MWTRRLAVVAATLLLLVPSVVTPSATARSPQRTGWAFGDLSGAPRANVLDDLGRVVPTARLVLRLLEGQVSFDRDTDACHGAESCSYARQGVDGRWGVHLDRQTLAARLPANRFIVLHELGHAVWHLVLDDSGRRAFVSAVHEALGGGPCLRDDGAPCAVVEEVFADEFARFAGGFAVSMSWYETPPLLDARAFASVLRTSSDLRL
jgi:hypothetical protein